MKFWTSSALLPVQASTMAPHVDALFLALTALTAFFGVLISGLIIYFAIRYRRRSPGQIGAPIRGDLGLEIGWTIIPTVIVIAIFIWSSRLFVAMAESPANALDVYVVGKQWMWKVQHRDGEREINSLHVPVGRPVRLTLTSQDVIHDFFIPAFRLKTDVVPGKYTRLWFTPTRVGTYHLFCAEYCGTNHSGMIGEIAVLSPSDYAAWQARGAGGGSLANTGRQLFQDLECDSCHRLDRQGRGPHLIGVFGSIVLLDSGQRVVADDAYVRQSILRPESQVVAGFKPLMPSFQGVVTEEQILALVEYIRSLRSSDDAIQQPPIPPSRQEERFAPSLPGSGPAATPPPETPR